MREINDLHAKKVNIGFSNGPVGVKALPVQRTPDSTRVDDHS
jgi:hypothetical protein